MLPQELITYGAREYSLAIDSKLPFCDTYPIICARFVEDGCTVNDSFDELSYLEAVALHEKKSEELVQDFKARLANDHGVEDHPKLDKLWSLAWEYGHSDGLYEVACDFANMAELLKD
jgi:hypothetical protein